MIQVITNQKNQHNNNKNKEMHYNNKTQSINHTQQNNKQITANKYSKGVVPDISLLFTPLLTNKLTNQSYLCFNPNCSNSIHRIFNEGDLHQKVDDCRHWLVKVKDLGEVVGGFGVKESNKHVSSIFISFLEGNFQDSVKVFNLIENIDWDKYFYAVKFDIINKIQQQLNKALDQIKQKIKNLNSCQFITKLTQLYSKIHSGSSQIQIKNCIQNFSQTHLASLSKKKITIKCPQLQNEDVLKSLLNLQGIKKRILEQQEEEKEKEKQSIKKQIPTLQPKKQNVQVSKEDQEQFKKFMEDEIGPFNRLQQVAAMCGKKCWNVHLKARTVALKCPFCVHIRRKNVPKEHFQQRQKLIKKQVAIKVLTHCFQLHYQQIFPKFQEKRQKKSIKTNLEPTVSNEITLSKMIVEMISGKYKKLHIIDRQTGIYDRTFCQHDPQIYHVQILSRSNKSMAKIRHIVTPDRKCTEFIINYILIYVCLVEKLVSSSEVTVDSNCKDVNKLQALSLLLTDGRINIISKKKEQQHVKHEDQHKQFHDQKEGKQGDKNIIQSLIKVKQEWIQQNDELNRAGLHNNDNDSENENENQGNQDFEYCEDENPSN